MSVHLDYSVLSTLQEVMEDEYPTLLDVFFKDSEQRLSQMRLALEPHGPDHVSYTHLTLPTSLRV